MTESPAPAPISLEEVLRRAAEDRGFAAEFLGKPVEAARSIGASLTSGEKRLLEIMSPTELRDAIERGGLEEVELRLHPSVEGNRFTWVEILVVLGVIAVLASVAGPMTSTSTGVGRVSATRSCMANLKCAIINFNNDIGRYPILGAIQNAESVNAAADAVLGKDAADNILINAEACRKTMADRPMGLEPDKFAKRWKGPYMDSDPTDFMFDAWETKIRYLHHAKAIWLHSAGSDKAFDDIEKARDQNYQGDDLVLSVARTKF